MFPLFCHIVVKTDSEPALILRNHNRIDLVIQEFRKTYMAFLFSTKAFLKSFLFSFTDIPLSLIYTPLGLLQLQ